MQSLHISTTKHVFTTQLAHCVVFASAWLVPQLCSVGPQQWENTISWWAWHVSFNCDDQLMSVRTATVQH